MTPSSTGRPPSSPARAILAVVVTSILWGTTGTVAAYAPQLSSLAVGAAALGLSGLLLALVALPQLKRESALLRAEKKLVILGAVAIMVYPLAFYTSMSTAGVAIGSVVSLASAPIFSGLVEWALEKRQLLSRWMVATMLGLTGSGLLLSSSLSSHGSSGNQLMPGIALGLVAGATYATYSWSSALLMTKGISRQAAMGAGFGLGGVLLMPVLLATGRSILESSTHVAVVGYMVLVPMFLGYLFFGYGLSRLPASTVTAITLLEPAVATLLAVIVVGERLALTGWLGIALFGLVLIVLSMPDRARH